MRGVEVPARTEDFTADPVELFFDLGYVFAFSQLVGVLIHDPSWTGVGKVALLFGLLWLPWQQLTWSANAVSGNGRTVRVIFLAATAISVPMAASTSSALGAGGPLFAVTLALIMGLGFWIQSLGVDGDEAGRTVRRWVAPNAVAVAILLAGAFVEGEARVVLWLVTAVIVVGAMVAAGRGEWLIRSGHMAERHGLIVIVALGEVIVAIGIPVVEALEADEGLSGQTITALAASGVFAALLWWSYFDRPSPALEHRGEQLDSGNERGRYVRDVYTAAHAPLVAGIILAAAALEEIALHPGDPVDLGFRLMLAGGLALGVLGVGLAVWSAFHVVAKERVVAGLAITVLVLAAGSVAGVTLLLAVVAIVFASLVVEHVRIER
ncbi:low temperature requirement protein A [Iamia majanohamensis]|uniref:Low temperature requirement protein A n=1 Tax=Iamia majanohamensis TaxID=467976 RepID=A0AAF0BUR3_9ACTN|nr:low temperature requirement protein A [Iamia majanohamensis]WCO65679.1 low temperature requirement protein A [Iamia majanohamensis]